MRSTLVMLLSKGSGALSFVEGVERRCRESTLKPGRLKRDCRVDRSQPAMPAGGAAASRSGWPVMRCETPLSSRYGVRPPRKKGKPAPRMRQASISDAAERRLVEKMPHSSARASRIASWISSTLRRSSPVRTTPSRRSRSSRASGRAGSGPGNASCNVWEDVVRDPRADHGREGRRAASGCRAGALPRRSPRSWSRSRVPA